MTIQNEGRPIIPFLYGTGQCVDWMRGEERTRAGWHSRVRLTFKAAKQASAVRRPHPGCGLVCFATMYGSASAGGNAYSKPPRYA